MTNFFIGQLNTANSGSVPAPGGRFARRTCRVICCAAAGLFAIAGTASGREPRAGHNPRIVSTKLSIGAPERLRYPASQTQTYRFNIPAGSLETAIATFQAVTGFKVTVPSRETIQTLTSPGVSGDYTAEQALEKLLGGTGLTFRATAADTYAVEVRIAPVRVEVTGHIIPYRVEELATATKTSSRCATFHKR